MMWDDDRGGHDHIVYSVAQIYSTLQLPSIVVRDSRLMGGKVNGI